MRLRIVALSGQSSLCKCVINKIQNELGYNFDYIIEEKRTIKTYVTHFKNKKKKYGLIKTIDIFAFVLYSAIKSINLEQVNIISQKDCDFSINKSNPPYYQTDNFNSADVESLIKTNNPDFILCIGAGIIKKNILDIPRYGTINLHTGLTPRYRGYNANFWAMYEEKYQDLGVTIYFLDDGIDTGKILGQKRLYHDEKKIDYYSMIFDSFIVGSELLSVFLHQVEKEGDRAIITREPIIEGDNLYPWFGLSDYLFMRRLTKAV